MKRFLFALSLLVVPALACAGDMWKWTDAAGVVHYSNVESLVPADAATVKTRVIREVSTIPSDTELRMAEGQVVEPAVDAAPAPRKRLHKIYDEERLRRGCFTAGVLYFGGWSHADDISPVMNCLPYMFGPEAWLNAAKAELALRQNGISERDLARSMWAQ
jgi:hypothetical protein